MFTRAISATLTGGRAVIVVLGILAFPFVLTAHLAVHAAARGFGRVAEFAATA